MTLILVIYSVLKILIYMGNFKKYLTYENVSMGFVVAVLVSGLKWKSSEVELNKVLFTKRGHI